MVGCRWKVARCARRAVRNRCHAILISVAIAVPGASVLGAGLPPDIAADRLLVKAEREALAGHDLRAQATLRAILKLDADNDLQMPGAFWFRYSKAARLAGDLEQAVEAASRYLTSEGRDGEHYAEALKILDRSEADMDEKRRRLEAEQMRLAAAERERLRTERLAADEYRTLRERLRAERSSHQGAFADALETGGYGPEMIRVPAGTFEMGCKMGRDSIRTKSGKWICYRAWASRRVRVEEFAISRHETTFADWDACVAGGGCSGYRPDDQGWGRGARPVMLVSWDDAQKYVAWLTSATGFEYRLPSEAEWEYAARAGSTSKYSWGPTLSEGRANCPGCNFAPWKVKYVSRGRKHPGMPTPVASFPPNAFGLFDVHGNVNEWVDDCDNPNYVGAPKDGSARLEGDCSRRGARGGSWKYALVELVNRSFYERDEKGRNHLGFRVARGLLP